MNTVLYLIRHGEVEYQHDEEGRKLIYGPDAHLSAEGKEQMRSLGRHLRRTGVRLDVLYTSPYERTKESASLIAAELAIFNMPSEKIFMM
ncbi:MAG TPA: phosphoglycerate mutase family protein [Patescibacteria group bacterium]|nr:phosphoglycerate mutase family protein [Patescibacteria group bacterium]